MAKEKDDNDNPELADIMDGVTMVNDEGPNMELDEEESEDEGKFSSSKQEGDEDYPFDVDEEEEEFDEEGEDEEEDEEDPELDLEEDEDGEGSDEPDEGEDEEVPLVEQIRQGIGYDFEEEFEDTEEGIQQLVEASAGKLAEDQLDNIFSQYPDVQELLEYRAMGGDPDKFLQTKFPRVDFEQVEFKEDDVQQHENLVRQELKEIRGYTEEEIDAELEDYKNGGILENKAKRALNSLQVKQQEEQENLLEQQKEEYKKQQKQVEQYWNNVNETIQKSQEFKGIQVPSKDKQEFFDYLSKPVEDGMSQRDIDSQQADLETRLAIDYLLYTGFDIAGLVKRKAKDKNAKTLREKMNKRKLSKKQRQRNSKGNGELQELDTI